jgi:hypothetical protein
MPMPNNVGYVSECLEDRPLVPDESGKQIPGEPQVRFKLKLRNTLGKEMIVWALLEDQNLRAEINDFLNPKTKTIFGNDPEEESVVDKLEAEVKKRIDAYLALRLSDPTAR